MTFNVADGHSPTAILSGIFSYSLAAVDNISTDLACARGPSAAAELLVLEREQTDRQTDRQTGATERPVHPRPARSIQPTCAIQHQNLSSTLLPSNVSFPI